MYLAAIALVAQGFLWSQSRYADVKHPRPSSSVAGVSSVLLAPVGAPQHAADTAQARFANISFVGSDLYTLEASCEPLRRPVAHQCAHVRAECDPPETFLSISYLESYFCSPTAVRPFTFAGLVLWLFFLFSFIGICASDFFCPNLATIADTLGLNENVAGVTFLAFGNGSPDLFSTFSAMRAGSGSLAIGELLGAASFIVSVVAGSMPLVRPFRVNPRSFVRDVGFFTVAVACILAILIDGEIHAWEAMAMVGLYLVYVTVVIGGSWWENRQDRLAKHEALIRGEYSDTPVEPDRNGNAFEPYRDDVSEPHRSLPTPSIRGRAHSNPSVPADQMLIPSGPHIASRPHLHIPGPSSRSRASSVSQSSPLTTSRSPSHVHQLPSFSLLGALEFRTVVNSLHGASTAETLSIFDAPVSPYVAGHYTRRLSAGRMSPAGSIYRMPVATAPPALDASRSDAERDPWDAAFSLQLNERNALTPTPAGEHNRAKSPVPSINVFSPSSPNGTSAAAPRKLFVPDDAPAPARWRTGLSELGHTLFPSLMGISARPWLWKIIAICSAPAIFALTLTLPVVVNESEAEDNPVRPVGTPAIEAQLIDYDESDAEEELLQAQMEAQEHVHDVHFSKWLTATQCAFSPVFCVSVLFAGQKHVGWYILAAVLCGISVATLTAVFADNGKNPAGRLARCFIGFGVAMVWIMAIADEVVQVLQPPIAQLNILIICAYHILLESRFADLQTFGHIFGLSDAIIGLTIFAIGNSLADFVANFTVAAFAPVMGVSACFGGPMLNMLLGIGLSGSYVISQTGESYKVNLSSTLLVSAVGLLCLLISTLVVVPFNNFNLTRRWGMTLIASYVVVMVVNVVVEVKKSS